MPGLYGWKRGRRTVGFACLVICGVALFPAKLHAASGGGFGVRAAHSKGSYFVEHLTGGSSRHESVVVRSASATPLHLLVYPVDGVTSSTSGAVYTNRGTALRGAGRWLAPEMTRLTVRPGQTATIPFSIRVPAGSTPGDHLGGIAVERLGGVPTSDVPSNADVAPTSLFRTVIGVLVRVPGAATFQPTLGLPSVTTIPGTHLAAIRVGIGDASNALGKPLLRVTVEGPHGYRRTVTHRLGTILPGDRIDYLLPWPDTLHAGSYWVVARADGGARPVLRGATIRIGHPLTGAVPPHPRIEHRTAPSVPWRVLSLGGGAILLTFALLHLFLTRRRRRKRLPARLPGWRTRSSLAAASIALIAGAMLLAAGAAEAAGTLTNINVSLSGSVAGTTGVNYTFSFTTASTENLTSITMTVPSGTSGTPALGTLTFPYGSNPTGGSVSLSGTTLTYSFTQFYVAGGSNVSIEITGLTNTATPGTYSSSIQTIGPSYESYPVVDSGTSGNFSISGGSLSSASWNVSNAATSATGVTYTYGFTTATTATLTSVTMSVPGGTGGTPTVGTVSGVPSGGSVSLASNTLTYSFSGTSVSGGTSVSIHINGLTNTSSAASYSSSLATHSSSGPVDTGSTGSVSFTSGALSSPTWSLSASGAGTTGVGYTYSFTTSTGSALTSISMTVPSGTAGTPTVGTITSTYSSLPTNGTVTLSSNTLTYSFASTYINPAYAISIEIDGLTNTSTTGSYTSQITTHGTGGAVDTGVTPSESISGGTLTGAVWTVSNAATGATNVTYTYTFTTASAASLTNVTMGVPSGTAGTPALGTVTGLPSGGTIALASNTLTYSFSSTAVAASTAVTIHVTGLTNTATVGSYTSQIATNSSGSPIDTGITAAVSISGGALTSPIWTSSSSTAAATGVTYTYSFKTGSSSSLSAVTMSVPPGTAGTATLGTVSGVPSGGTIALASNTLTYSFASTYLNAGTSVSIHVSGLTNTATTGSYTSQIATKNATTPVDTGTTAAVSISGGALTNMLWSLSSGSSGATNVTYTYRFETASDANLTSVTMTVPPGTAGTPSVGTVSGVPSGGSIALASNTLTYSFSATEVMPSTIATIHVTGLTNTTSTGNYTSQLATYDASGPIDTGTTAAIAIGGGTLASPIWTADAAGSGATNVTYGYSFTSASGGALTSITMTVPPGTAGTPTVGTITSTNSALPTNGTVTLGSDTLTYSFASTYLNAGYDVSISILGVTNTLTPGSYTSQIVTQGTGGPIDSGTTAAIAITGGTLQSPIWLATSFASGATGVIYTYTFTTSSSSSLDSVTMTVPPGTAGTPAVGTVVGVPGTGTVTLASNTLTYAFAPTVVAPNTAVSIAFTGLHNTTTTGSYTAQITTNNGANPIDAGVTAGVSIGGGTLTLPTWTPTSFAAGHTGTSYTYSFVTGSSSSLASITMTVPPGTSGTPVRGTVTSTNNAVPANGTVTLASNKLTYAFTAAYVNAGYTVSIQITGLSNTGSAGSYTSQITTVGSLVPVDSGVTKTVAIANGNPYLAYVVNGSGASVMPLHLGTGSAGLPTSLGTAPAAIAMAPGGATAYVADSSANTLIPVTVSSGSAGSPISLTGCTSPSAVAVTPDGTKAYVTCSGNAKTVPVTLPGGSVGSAISVGTTPAGVAISPDGSTAYVVASGSANITPITISSNTAGTAISLSGCSAPDAIAVLPSGASVYVACSGSAKVLPISLPAGTVGSAIGVGTTPSALAVAPDGGTVYVANAGSGTVTPITVSSGSAGSAISVGSTPDGIAVSPDGTTAYVANHGDNTVTPIKLSNNTAGSTITVGTGPTAVAFVPDQAPQAALSVTPGASGAVSSFDASASTSSFGTIATYAWSFGDGTTASGSSPTTTHTYAAGCDYTVTVTETDSAGTSMTQVFTGQSASRNGGSGARTTGTVAVTQSFGFVGTLGDVSFSGSLTGVSQTLTSALAIDVGIGVTTAGWNISATSTTFSVDGHTLPTTAVTVQSSPTAACDGAAACTTPSNDIAYPFMLPAGTTAPTAAILMDASSGSGLCDQTVTPTFSLAIPGGAYAGRYSSTWTFTLSSGP